MIRLSVTHLEAVRHWKDRDDTAIDDLVADLTYSRPKTPRMAAGGALASTLEHLPVDQVVDYAERDGWKFDFRELQASLPEAASRELKIRREMETSTGMVTLTGKADGFSALALRDQKLSDKFEPDRYLDSLQWRAYLWLFGARSFTYDVFVGRIDEGKKEVRVVEYHPMTLYSYPDVGFDVHEAVDELAAIVRRYRVDNKALQSAFPEEPDDHTTEATR